MDGVKKFYPEDLQEMANMLKHGYENMYEKYA